MKYSPFSNKSHYMYYDLLPCVFMNNSNLDRTSDTFHGGVDLHVFVCVHNSVSDTEKPTCHSAIEGPLQSVPRPMSLHNEPGLCAS